MTFVILRVPFGHQKCKMKARTFLAETDQPIAFLFLDQSNVQINQPCFLLVLLFIKVAKKHIDHFAFIPSSKKEVCDGEGKMIFNAASADFFKVFMLLPCNFEL